jgi:hypothetical protein
MNVGDGGYSYLARIAPVPSRENFIDVLGDTQRTESDMRGVIEDAGGSVVYFGWLLQSAVPEGTADVRMVVVFRCDAHEIETTVVDDGMIESTEVVGPDDIAAQIRWGLESPGKLVVTELERLYRSDQCGPFEPDDEEE